MSLSNTLLICLCLCCLALLFWGISTTWRKGRLSKHDIKTWVCVYDDGVSPADVSKFDLAVLDADSHPPLEQVASTTLKIGYVSLGEVERQRWFWQKLEGKNLIVGKNPNWDSFMIDVRQKAWHTFVLDTIIPPVLEQGFDGLFLDTIDTAEYLEKYYKKEKFPGAEAAMVKLIQSIRTRYPDVLLIANRGFSILEKIAPVIDGILAESVFTEIDFKNNTTSLREASLYEEQLKKLAIVKREFKLVVFTLDYFNDETDDRINQVIAESRAHDFVPFVSTKELCKIYFHTLAEK